MSVIYEPRGQAREYAPLACNIYTGCDHGCTYCYAPSATYKSREQFACPKTRAGDFLKALKREAEKMAGCKDRVLLCFTCDPYQSLDVQAGLTRQTIRILHDNNIAVQVLTKGGRRALRDIHLFTDKDAFATTMTQITDEASAEWEPGAASPSDRIYTLKMFHAAGIPTWVSLEPVLNPEAALEIIRRTHAFVDLYKVGKLNYHPLAQQIDWHKFAQEAVTLLDSLGKRYYIKDSLLPYLPGFKKQNPDDLQT